VIKHKSPTLDDRTHWSDLRADRNTVEVAKSDLAQLKLGKLEGGSARAGDCPEGEVLWRGEYLGDWAPDTEDAHSCSYSQEQRVVGYYARFDYLSADVFVSVDLRGAHAASAKALLRRALAAELLRVEAKGFPCACCGDRYDVRSTAESCCTDPATCCGSLSCVTRTTPTLATA
jgi:hypothetical protein